ncbi:hypothetical protein [Emticicia sp. SJ17W-69]|uniref:hypothetical protein n=1 Tax=Emticicia sp. SJ17W-69 TaxID=3421657 RepID=UPI003EBF80B8
MKLIFEVIICILPIFLALRLIFWVRKHNRVSDFMKTMIPVMISCIIFLSLSVSLHHFSNFSIDQASNWSVGMLPILQIILSGVIYGISLFLKNRYG